MNRGDRVKSCKGWSRMIRLSVICSMHDHTIRHHVSWEHAHDLVHEIEVYARARARTHTHTHMRSNHGPAALCEFNIDAHYPFCRVRRESQGSETDVCGLAPPACVWRRAPVLCVSAPSRFSCSCLSRTSALLLFSSLLLVISPFLLPSVPFQTRLQRCALYGLHCPACSNLQLFSRLLLLPSSPPPFLPPCPTSLLSIASRSNCFSTRAN